jgi:hypothetical protein
MNMLDMHTRETANRIHINKMQQDAKARHILHQAKQDENVEAWVRGDSCNKHLPSQLWLL